MCHISSKVRREPRQQCGFTQGASGFQFLVCLFFLMTPHSQPCCHPWWKDLTSPFQTDTFHKSNAADRTSVFGNTINIVITTLLWAFVRVRENRKSESLCFNHRISQICFPSPSSVLLIRVPLSPWRLVFPAPPDDANIVSESTEVVDVSPSITTNIIGQKTDDVGADMCERSCEELSTMFQELKGLRHVVSNLIDGLQKVVSIRSDRVQINSLLTLTLFVLHLTTQFKWQMWNQQNLSLQEGRESTFSKKIDILGK